LTDCLKLVGDVNTHNEGFEG